MATAEVDVARLSSFCAVPQASLESLLDKPTTDLVRTLLQSLLPRVHEYDGLKADKLKLHVELENAVRGGESKSRALKNSIDKGQKENASLKQKIQEEEQARTAVESELETLKSSTSNSTSEVTALKTRITSLESSNRDTLSLLETKSAAYDKLTEELSNQHQKTVELHQEVATLEQRVQFADANASTARYREQSLSQEIEQLKRNNDWLDRELKAKSQEYSSFRKEKNARLVELQRLHEEATNSIEAARRMEQTLRGRIDELSGKVEEYLSRIQQISEEATRVEESHKKRNDSNERLLELTRNSVATERSRLQELQEELESTKENAQDEISRLTSEIETDGHARDAAEQRTAELEIQVERLEAEVTEMRAQRREDVSLQNGVNGQPATPNRAESPASIMFSPHRSRMKGGLSMTQLYSQNTELKTEIAGLRGENERLKASVDEMLQDAESARPEIEEARTENARLESEAAEMSALVGRISKERDQAVKIARRTEGDIEAKTREGELLRQQLRDLSMQIKILLFELDRREKGLDNFTTEQQIQLEQLSRDEADSGATDTDRFITAELVMYRKTAELQNQNNKLLRLTRELGARMEREEALRNEAEASKDTTDYKQLYGQCQDEIRSLLAQSQSYIRERDMFRRMLTHRGQLPPNDDSESAFARSINGVAAPATPSQSNLLNSVEESPHSKDMANYAKLLKEMQSHFDSYRTEASTDNRTLRDQADKLSAENRELRGDNIKKENQVTLADERYQMLQSNYSMLKSENGELQKRSQFFSDNAAKQELRTQQAAEDLVEAKGLLDSMRNDNANLKAEKEFFKTVEKRLTADNEAHFTEKARLNSLNTSLQNLLNERDQAEADTRRKLQAQIDMLEHELQAAKRTLSDQTEEFKRTTDRRDYDHHQSQKRIDDLLASLGSVREELAAAKASREHLQAHVDELTTTLRSAEERLQLLQPGHSGKSNDSTQGQSIQVNGNGNGEPTSPTREQELAVEMSELRRDLQLAKNDLENAKAQVEQYKAISQSSEEELQSLNETQELYRHDMDKMLEDRNNQIRQLEQRISDVHNELTSTNSELTELRTKEAETDRKIQEQKSIVEAEIARLKDQDDRHATAAKFHQEDLKAQAAIAQQAQQNYENELVKHAEAAKALQKVRGDFNELKVQVVELKTEADSARTNLAQSEESWIDTKARYESEINDLNEGKRNLAGQNDRLHQQLETLGIQIANLQKRSASDGSEMPGGSGVSSGLDNLQEVIRYLRREKEIVDVQLELSAQETKRLNQQLNYTQIQLDETRLKLNQQRRVEQDTERSALNHNKLVDTINELNTFRESNVTLRNESRQAQASLASKIREVEQLVAQVEPLQAEVRNLRDQQENQTGESRLLQEDRDRWRQRTQDILQKYDRVDPAELEALKNELQDLKTEREQLLLSKQTLQEQVDGHEGQTKEKVEELRSRLTEQFKTRSKQLTGTIREKDASLQAVAKEKQELGQRLERLQQDLERASAEKDQAIENANAATAKASTANAPSGSEDGQVDENEPSKAEAPDIGTLQEKLEAAEAKASEEAVRSSGLQNNLSIATSRISELETQIQEVQQKLDTVSAEFGQLQAQQSQNEASAASNAASKESLDRLQHELEKAQEDANNLRAAASIQASSDDTTAVEGGKSVAEQLSEMREEMRNAIQTELEARHDERVRNAEETFERRTQNMKIQLSKKLSEGKEQLRQENEEALQELRAAHTSELEDLKRRHQEELDELKRQDETRFAEFKTLWAAEHKPLEKVAEVAVAGRKEDDAIPNASWEPTEAEVRNLVSSNATIRNIINGNINRKVSEAKNGLTAQLNEEHAKEMATKVQAAQANAVHMEAMKSQVRFSTQEKRLKTCQAQIEIVTKAADDTPSRPVVEVWTIAKDAKPAAVPPLAPSNPAGSTTRSGNVPQNPPVQQPAAASQPTQVLPQPGTFGQPITLTPLQQPRNPSGPALAPSGNALQASNIGLPQQSRPIQPGSNLPARQQPQAQLGNHPIAGAAQATLRGSHASALPFPRGGSQPNRGGGRGRGQGQGQTGRGNRGGVQSVNTHPSQIPNRATPPSPTSLLSGAARQFVPQGNKRPRDDGEGTGQHAGDGSNGKRMRGGIHQ